MASLLSRLLLQGDAVLIERGILTIKPASGLEVPDWWLANSRQQLLKEIFETINTDAFEYLSYTTGKYGTRRESGLAAQFVSVRTGRSAYAIFNVKLTRERSSYGKKAGTDLPKGHFRVGKRSHFYKFWESTGLPIRRLSDFHDYMGKLKGPLFTGDITKGERIDTGTLKTFTVTAAEIRRAVLDNPPTPDRQRPDTLPTILPDNDSLPAYESRGLQACSATWESKYGNAYTRESEDKRALSTKHTQSEHQSLEEWDAAYDSARPLYLDE